MNSKKEGTKMATDYETNVEVLPLSKILSNLEWNSRNKMSVLQEGGSGDEDEGGKMTTDELSTSIEERGQDTPVHVVVNQDKATKAKWSHVLVAGFKRYEAMRRLSERALHNKNVNPIASNPSWSAKNPTILAKVDTLTESEARFLNLRENTARANLTMPDTAFGLMNCFAALKAEGKPLPTDTKLAADLGLSQGFLSKIHRIVDAVGTIKDGAIIKNWREARVPLTMAEMTKVTKEATPERMYEAYSTAVSGKAATTKESEEKDPNAWIDKAKSQATDFAVAIGRLVAANVLDKDAGDGIDWTACVAEIPELVKLKKGAEVKEVVLVGRAAQAGYIFGLSKAAKEEAEEKEAEAKKLAEKLAKKNAKEDAAAEPKEPVAAKPKNGKGEAASAAS
jgi:hypothetical protein